jgi:hypothetical protein
MKVVMVAPRAAGLAPNKGKRRASGASPQGRVISRFRELWHSAASRISAGLRPARRRIARDSGAIGPAVEFLDDW